LFGFFYVKQLQQGRDPGSLLNSAADRIANLFKRKSDLKITYRRKEKSTVGSNFQQNFSAKNNNQDRLDSILDNISQSGYDSLSKEEKEFLFRMSEED